MNGQQLIEKWTTPKPITPGPAFIKRKGPPSKFKPIIVAPPKKRWAPASFEDVHRQKNTFNNSAAELVKEPIFAPKRVSAEWPPETVEKLTELYNEGKTAQEIAEALGKTASAVQRKLSRIGTKKQMVWTPEKVQTLDELLKSGYTNAQIARIMNTSKRSIESAMSRYRLRRKP